MDVWVNGKMGLTGGWIDGLMDVWVNGNMD